LKKYILSILGRKKYIIPLLAILCIIALLISEPIPQDQNYHDFADQRKVKLKKIAKSFNLSVTGS